MEKRIAAAVPLAFTSDLRDKENTDKKNSNQNKSDKSIPRVFKYVDKHCPVKYLCRVFI